MKYQVGDTVRFTKIGGFPDVAQLDRDYVVVDTDKMVKEQWFDGHINGNRGKLGEVTFLLVNEYSECFKKIEKPVIVEEKPEVNESKDHKISQAYISGQQMVDEIVKSKSTVFAAASGDSVWVIGKDGSIHLEGDVKAFKNNSGGYDIYDTNGVLRVRLGPWDDTGVKEEVSPDDSDFSKQLAGFIEGRVAIIKESIERAAADNFLKSVIDKISRADEAFTGPIGHAGALRGECFDSCSRDEAIISLDRSKAVKSDGGSSSYYDIPVPAELWEKLFDRSEDGQCYIKTEEMIEHFFGNDFDFGTLFKSLVRAYGTTLGGGKEGNDVAYEVGKIKYYADKIKEKNS